MSIEQVALLVVGLVGGSLVKIFFDVIQTRYTEHLTRMDELKTQSAVQQQQINDMTSSRAALRQEASSANTELTSDVHRTLDTINRGLAELLRDVAALRSEVAEFRGRQSAHMSATDTRLDVLERRLERLEQTARGAP